LPSFLPSFLLSFLPFGGIWVWSHCLSHIPSPPNLLLIYLMFLWHGMPMLARTFCDDGYVYIFIIYILSYLEATGHRWSWALALWLMWLRIIF
jgi:hypothetical protein